MTIEATHDHAWRRRPRGRVIHPAWVRVTHWINAVAMVVMIGSGWEIYNASPLFPFTFPREITLGGWLAGALLWHFAAMWLLAVNGLVYMALGIVTGRFRRKLVPIRPSDVLADAKAALTGKLSHDDLSVYNAVQKLLYLGVILAGIVIVLSGLAIWKPVQLQELTALFGGYEAARYVHFFAMAVIVGFLVVHVVMALLVPKSLRAIITGRMRRLSNVPHPKKSARRRSKLLIKDAAKLMPDPTRRLFLRGGASLGALAFLTGCDIVDGLSAENALTQDFLLQRPRAGLDVQPEQARADLSRERGHAAVPVQRLLPRGRSTRGRQGGLQARGRRHGRQQEILDARRALCAAAGNADHPPYLRRGLERDRQMVGRAVLANSCAASAPTRARNTSGSVAPRATPPRSTWRPRCIRRRR